MSRRIGMGFSIAGWMLMLVLLAWLGDSYFRERNEPNRGLMVGGSGPVVLKRSRGGHYLAPGLINGKPVRFIVDTGASLVALSETLAARVGAGKGAEWPMQTANGAVIGWRSTLDSVQLGALRQSRVPAVIMPNLDNGEVLLGMSFLRHLELIQRGDQLVLQAPAAN
ncbi:MAG: TIGR02281 family clan AA aspartic protease [Pseudomonadota bacterium]